MSQGEEIRASTLSWVVGVEPDIRRDVWEDFSAVYEECFPVVLWYAVSRVHDPRLAEDLVGETFERALRAWASYRRDSSRCRWILGIARRVIAAHYRTQKAKPLRLDDTLLMQTRLNQPTPEEQADRHDELDRLREALQRLSSQERELVVMRYGGELPIREIAGAFRLREGTVRVRLHRVLHRLRRLLDEE